MNYNRLIQLLLACLLTAHRVTAAEVGLYDLSDEIHPKPLLDKGGRVVIASQSNDNKEYYLTLHAAASFSLPCTQIGLIVGEKTIRFSSLGPERDKCASMGTT